MTPRDTPQSVGAALFQNALAGWGNDDLMLDAKTRDGVEALFPGWLRVLDWPELRDLFTHHNALASRSKTISRRTGIAALLIAGAGVALLALIPAFAALGWLPQRAEPVVAAASLAMLCLGTAIGLWHWIGLRERQQWLGHRFWTERLRQLHFQVLISQVELAAAAVEDDDRLEQLRTLRKRRLAEMVTRLETHAAIRAICGDLAEQEAWLVRPGKAKVACDPARLETLLELLGMLRLQVQLDYVGRSLSASLHAPTLRAQLLGGVANALTIAVVPTAAIAAVYYFSADKASAQAWAGVVGAISALGLTARAIEQGLRATADTERLHWYHAALVRAAQQFEAGGARARIDALEDVELLSYQELRRFLVTHGSARFLT